MHSSGLGGSLFFWNNMFSANIVEDFQRHFLPVFVPDGLASVAAAGLTLLATVLVSVGLPRRIWTDKRLDMTAESSAEEDDGNRRSKKPPDHVVGTLIT